MKTNKIIYIMVSSLFLFSCESSELVDADIEVVPYTSDPVGYETDNDSAFMESVQCTNIPRPAGTYVYPVVPGMEEWKELHKKGMDEVLKACRVPEAILQNQSTPAVIQTFFDYPFAGSGMITSSSTSLNGFVRSVVYNDAYTELLKRKDAGKWMLEMYQVYNPVGCGGAMFLSSLWDLLQAQPEFYSQLNMNEKKELVKAVLGKIKARVDIEQRHGYSDEIACLLIGRVMVSAAYIPFVKEVKLNEELAQFIETQHHAYSDFDAIISYASKFIK